MAEYNILKKYYHHSAELNYTLVLTTNLLHFMVTNPKYCRRTRHIERRYHYMRKQVKQGVIELHKFKGEEPSGHVYQAS